MGPGVAHAEDGPAPRPWPAGRPTPAVQLPAQEGGTLSLADLQGRPVLLNFWASWCEPCRAEMPSLELLETRHAADGLRVLAVNFRETDATVRRFIDSAGLTLGILRDRDRDGAAAQAFGVRVFPSTVGIGRDGRARFVVVGEVDWTGAQAAEAIRRFEPQAGAWRTFEVSTNVTVAEPQGVTRLWLPVPDLDTDRQKTLDNGWTGNAGSARLVADPAAPPPKTRPCCASAWRPPSCSR